VAVPPEGYVNGTAFVADAAETVGGAPFSVPVRIGLVVEASASADPTEAGVPTTFTAVVPNGTLGGPFTLQWRFGDGDGAAGSSVSHTYAESGDFTVVVSVGNSYGVRNATELAEDVTPHLAVGVSANRTAVDVGEPIEFTASPTGGAGSVGLEWGFGDGRSTNGSAAESTHAYAVPGIFVVNVTATDALGATSDATVSVTVNPTLSVTAEATPSGSIAAGTTVDFAGVAAGGTPGFVFAWSFGDGEMASGAAVSHAFREAGNYTVALRTNDSTGELAFAHVSVEVRATSSGRTTGPPGAGGLGGGPTDAELAAAIAAGIAGALLAAVWIRRWRRRT
jgi:PKD repeat protein